MELSAIQKFRAMNDRHTNLKECQGMIIKPVAFHTHNYEDDKGKVHQVLVIFNGKDGKMYKTEVAAFIEKFMAYDEAFGNEPDEKKPEIVITLKTSRANNKYVNFDLVESAE